jgi:hypothetical protein
MIYQKAALYTFILIIQKAQLNRISCIQKAQLMASK